MRFFWILEAGGNVFLSKKYISAYVSRTKLERLKQFTCIVVLEHAAWVKCTQFSFPAGSAETLQGHHKHLERFVPCIPPRGPTTRHNKSQLILSAFYFPTRDWQVAEGRSHLNILVLKTVYLELRPSATLFTLPFKRLSNPATNFTDYTAPP